jgi:hypothetical protein
MMRGGAGFDAHGAWRKALEVKLDLTARELSFRQDSAIFIDGMNLENVLCNIQTDNGNFAHELFSLMLQRLVQLPPVWWKRQAGTSDAFVPGTQFGESLGPAAYAK